MKIKSTHLQTVFLFALLLSFESSLGQSVDVDWYKTVYNKTGPKKRQVIKDMAVSKLDGSVFIVGSVEGNNQDSLGAINFSTTVNRAGFLAKYTKNGAFLWAWKIDGSGDEEVTSVALNSVGEIVIGGYFTQTIIFYNYLGSATSPQADIVGERNAFVVKIRADASDLVTFNSAQQYYKGVPSYFNEVSDISIDSLNNAFVSINYNGYLIDNGVLPFLSLTATGNDAVVMIYFASNGLFALNALAYRRFIGNGDENITALSNYLGDLFIAGNTTSDTIKSRHSSGFNPSNTATFTGSNNNIFVSKCKSLLVIVSTQTSHNNRKQYVTDAKCVHGKLYLTGALKIGSTTATFLGPTAEPDALLVSTPDTTTKAFIAKYNINLSAEWLRILGDATSRSAGRQIDLDVYGNIYLAGRVSGNFIYKTNDDNNFFYNTVRIVSDFSTQDTINTTLADGFLSKFDKNGNQLWMRLVGSINQDDAEGTAVKIHVNSIFFGGHFSKKFKLLNNNVEVETEGNQNIQNIIFGRLNPCLKQAGKIVSNPENICAGELYTLVAKDYFGEIRQWEKINADSSSITFIYSTADTLLGLQDSVKQFYRYLVDEGPGCPALYSNKIEIAPLPKPLPFNLSTIYPSNENDSIEIEHADSFNPAMDYLWQTSPDQITWNTVSTNFNYYYPNLPDSFVYIKRTVNNPLCTSFYSDTTKIARENIGTIILHSTTCDLIGDTVSIKLSIDSASSNFNILGWEKDLNDGFGFTTIANSDSSHIEDFIHGKTIYRVKLQHTSGGVFYSDTLAVINIPLPNPLLNQDSKTFCAGETGLMVTGANNNILYNYQWNISSLKLAFTIYLDTITLTDTLIFNHPFPNDSILLERFITVDGCPAMTYTSVSSLTYDSKNSVGGNLFNDGLLSESTLCKYANIDLHLIKNEGDSIQWGYSYDGISIDGLSTYTSSDSVTFEYDGSGNYIFTNNFLDILQIPLGDSILLYVFAIVTNGSCNADTSSWFKINIATAPAQFGFTNDSALFCASREGILEVYTGADLNSISWTILDGFGTLDSASGSTSLLSIDYENTNVEVLAKITDINGCVFSDSIVALWSTLPDQTYSGVTNILCEDYFEIEAMANLPNWFSENFVLNNGNLISTPNLGGDSFSFVGFNYGPGQLTYQITDTKCNTPYQLYFYMHRPYLPNAGEDRFYCNASSIVLNSSNVDFGQWTFIDSNLVNDPTIIEPNNDTTAVVNMEAGNYYFVWTGTYLTDGGCPNNSDTVMIINGIAPTIGNIQSDDADNSFCSQNNNVTLWCSAIDIDSIWWETVVLATNDTLINYNNDTIINLSNFLNSTNVRMGTWSNSCGVNYSASIMLQVLDPSIGVIDGNNSYCSNSLDGIELAIGMSAGAISWLQSTDNVNFIPVMASDPNILLINEISENTYIQAYSSLNGCVSDIATFFITYVPAIVPILDATDTLCFGNNVVDLNTFLDQPYIGSWNIFNGEIIPSNYGGSNVTIIFTTTTCPETVSDDIYILPAPNTDTNYYKECTLQISIPMPIDQSGNWILPNELNYVENTAANALVFTSSISGNYSGTAIYSIENGGCENNFYYNFSFFPIDAEASAGEDIILDNLYSTSLSASSPTYGTGAWSVVAGNGFFNPIDSNNSTVENLIEGNNILVWTIENGLCSVSDELIVAVNGLLIPTGFSPDGDGVNDVFTIKGLNMEKNTSLMVFNTMGQEVFADNNYKNNWQGKDSRGKDLPNDTYYLILNIENTKEYKGYVVIKK